MSSPATSRGDESGQSLSVAASARSLRRSFRNPSVIVVASAAVTTTITSAPVAATESASGREVASAMRKSAAPAAATPTSVRRRGLRFHAIRFFQRIATSGRPAGKSGNGRRRRRAAEGRPSFRPLSRRARFSARRAAFSSVASS